MPSPFPGMDPYLEDPRFWPDVHQVLASEIRRELNRLMPEGYFAQGQYRYEMDILAEDDPRDRQARDADVALTRERPRRGGGAAVLELPRREITEKIVVVVSDPVRRAFVEIRQSSDKRLVTVLEILSPSNKRPGGDRDAFAAKQRETIGAGVHLVAIDLLRGGERLFFGPKVRRRVERLRPWPDYLVTVDIAGCEGILLKTVLYPASIREMLPCLGVPLAGGDPNVPLDLQYVFQNTYDSGPYRRGVVNYAQPPTQPLTGEDVAWAEGLTRRET